MAGFTIGDLKKHLGPGLGLRKNKYLIEIPVPGIQGQTINILCRSAGLPERNITTKSIWHKGRKYQVRGETDYVGTYDVSIVDDSEMKIRKMFDKWAKNVDNSKPVSEGILGGSFESGIGDAIDAAKGIIQTANTIKGAIENPERIVDFFLGYIDSGKGLSAAVYQTDINIWQLDNNGNKVYGYKLQNAFPQQIGIVTLDDGDENTLSEFSVTFSFSEFAPLENSNKNIFGTIFGDSVAELGEGIESLFE